MATVWDEAEVCSGAAGGPRTGPAGRPPWREGRRCSGVEVWPGPRVGAAGDVGKDPDSFVLVVWTGKLRPSGLGESGHAPLIKKNFFCLNSKMESGKRCSRCPQKRLSSAHGCWTVKSRWASRAGKHGDPVSSLGHKK